VDTFSGDGTTTAFTLSTTPGNINQTIANYNGVTVLRSTYLLSGAVITFSSAPAAGSEIEVTTINPAGAAAAAGTALKITTIGYVGNNTATDVAGGETITLTGTGFATGASVIINGVAAGVVTVVSATQLTFTAPALSAGTYIFYVVNTDGATAISVPGISYSGVPSFYVGAGSVGTVYEASSFNSNVAAVGDSAITYTIASGSLPAGATLNANGVITGSSVLTASPTTYTFGVNASDGQNQDVTRSYTITVNPDTVSWSSPTNGATVSIGQGSASSTTLTAASAAGKAITYTANVLPTGLSIVGSAVTGTPTVLGNTTTLLTANATSTTRSATVTVVWNIAVSNDPYFAYNSLLLSGDGTNNANNNTFIDSSTNNYTVTRNGNTTQGTFSPYGPNWSNYFDGSGDYLTIPSNSAFQITGDFTIEAWVYATSITAWHNIMSQYQNSTNSFACGYNVTQGWYFNYANNAAEVTNYRAGTSPLNAWTHVAFVKSSTTMTVYVNGTALASTITVPNLPSLSSTLNIGIWAGSLDSLWNGYISNIRMVKGTAVYTGNFTPSTTPLTAITNTSLLTCQSNRFIDNSTNNFTITKNGDTTIQRFSPFGPSAVYSTSTIGGSGYFDGTGDYLTAPCPSMSGTWTVELWLYPTLGGTQQTFVSFNSGGVAGINIWMDSSNQIVVDDGQVASGLFTGGTFKIGAWNHTAIVRNGTTTTAYINGVSVGSNSFTPSGVNTISVGRYNGGSFYYIKGYISNLRVVIGTAVYTSAFTPPTSPVTAIANTQVLLNYTNAGIIDSTMQNNLETVGSAQISTTQSKFGSSSLYFNGSSTCTIPGNPSLTLGTADFTIEMWVYSASQSSGGNRTIGNGAGASWGANKWIFTTTTPGNLNKFTWHFWNYNSGGSDILVSTSASNNSTWTHIAVTRSGNTFRMFVNGVLETSLTSSASVDGGVASQLTLGNSGVAGDSSWTGYLDDLRITKGLARYTTTFTPPTSAFIQK
jgi:hypothetical protein